MNPLNELERLSDLKHKGLLTEKEFNQQKKKILNNTKDNHFDRNIGVSSHDATGASKGKKSAFKKVIFTFVLIAIICIIGFFSFYLYGSFHKTNSNKNLPYPIVLYIRGYDVKTTVFREVYTIHTKIFNKGNSGNVLVMGEFSQGGKYVLRKIQKYLKTNDTIEVIFDYPEYEVFGSFVKYTAWALPSE
ncbi:MAG: hypothetical protein HW421_2111 [Ignavibacteria bacterium]|nr:hypothetical protein [Ignavibacteria bacterium]